MQIWNVQCRIEFNKSCESSQGDRRCLHNLSESFLLLPDPIWWGHPSICLPPSFSILVTSPSLLLTRPWSVAFSIMRDQRPDARESVAAFVPLSHAVRGPEPRPSAAPSISLLSALWEGGGARRLPTFQCSLVWSKPQKVLNNRNLPLPFPLSLSCSSCLPPLSLPFFFLQFFLSLFFISRNEL